MSQENQFWDASDDGEDGQYEGDDIDAFNDETFGNADEWNEDEHQLLVERDVERQTGENSWSPWSGGQELFNFAKLDLGTPSPSTPATPTTAIGNNRSRPVRDRHMSGTTPSFQHQQHLHHQHQHQQKHYEQQQHYHNHNHHQHHQQQQYQHHGPASYNHNNNIHHNKYRQTGQQHRHQQQQHDHHHQSINNSNINWKQKRAQEAPMVVPPQVQLSVIEHARKHHSVTALHPDEFIQDRVPTNRDGFLFRRHSEARCRQHDGTLNEKEKSWLIKIQQQIQAKFDSDEIEDWYYLLYTRQNTRMTANDLLRILQQKLPIPQLGPSFASLLSSADSSSPSTSTTTTNATSQNQVAPNTMAGPSSSGADTATATTASGGPDQYLPRQFVGSLGKITVSNVNRPRRLLDMES